MAGLQERVHEQDLSAQKRDDGVILTRVEEEHVRATHGFLRRFLAELADFTGKIDRLRRLCGGRVGG